MIKTIEEIKNEIIGIAQFAKQEAIERLIEEQFELLNTEVQKIKEKAVVKDFKRMTLKQEIENILNIKDLEKVISKSEDDDLVFLKELYCMILENLTEDIKKLTALVQQQREEAVREFIDMIKKEGVTVYVEAPKVIKELEKKAEEYISQTKGNKE